jgi:hypothetical protein
MRLRGRSVPDNVRRAAIFLGGGRIVFGAVMVLAPNTFLGVARTPADQINSSSRLLTRMTGARDILLGANLLRHLGDRDALRRAALLNAAADGGDTLALTASAREEGFFIAGASGVPVAASACAGFLGLARSLD